MHDSISASPATTAPSTLETLEELKQTAYEPIVPVRLTSRETFLEAFPDVAAILDATPSHPHAGDRLTVELRHVASLVHSHHFLPSLEIKGQVPIFRLPAIFESVLPELLAHGPMPYIAHTLDSRAAHDVATWATPPTSFGGTIFEVWMDGMKLANLLYAGGWDYDSPWPGRWQPVIMMAGDTVAIGGLWADADLMDSMQCAQMSAQSHFPLEHLTPDELEKAEAKALVTGATPWRNGLWFEKDADGTQRCILLPPEFEQQQP